MPVAIEPRRPFGARERLGLAGLVLLTLLIGAIDWWSGPEITVTIVYLVPIGLGAWYFGRAAGIVLSVLSAAAWLWADLYGGRAYPSPIIPPWNAAVSLALFLIISIAISARRRTEQRLLELMEVRSRFTAMISHELRTPLACIKEGIDIVADGSSGPLTPAQESRLAIAKRNVDRLARLLDQVLAHKQLESGRMQVRPRRVEIDVLVAQVHEAFELPARRKGVQLSAELGAGTQALELDPDLVCQVLANLVGNALKFAPRGRVVLRTERLADEVRISVEDEGPGIAVEDIPRLFQHYTRLETGGPHTEGTGLGLAIAREIVELHRGRIWVESERGQGARFRFTLPHAQARERARDAALTAAAPAGTS